MIQALAGNGIRRSLTATTLVLVMVGATAGSASAGSAVFDCHARWSKSPQSTENTFSESWRLEPGQTIRIRGTNGGIHAEAADGDEVEVVATKRWRDGDPSTVRVESYEDEDGVTVCALYPGEECEDEQHGSSGSKNGNHNDISVEFEVRVPSGIRLVAHTVNGGIEVETLDGPVEATTVNGSVEVRTHGLCQATTVNGSIHAALGASSWDDEIAFTTVNGAISVQFPHRVNARISASTMNGSIASDFPVKVEHVSKKKLYGTLGHGGGGALMLHTVNGNIELRSED